MDLNKLTDQEVVLAARALSIHRGMLRRKLQRIPRNEREHANTMNEIVETTELIAKLQTEDLRRLGAA